MLKLSHIVLQFVMVLHYLLTFVRSRLLIKTKPAAKFVVNTMERVTVRCVEGQGDEFMTISFVYGSKHSNLLRPKNEPLEKCLERIKACVRKAEKKSNQRKNKKAKTDYYQSKATNAQLEISESADCIKCALLTGHAGKFHSEVKPTCLNKDAWVEGNKLQICDTVYQVFRNLPTVLSLKLPNRIMAGCPVYPRINIEFAKHDECSYVWYQGVRCKPGSNVMQTSMISSHHLEQASSLKSTDNQEPTLPSESGQPECESQIPMAFNSSNNSEDTTLMGVDFPPLDSSLVTRQNTTKIKAVDLVWIQVSQEKVFTPSETMIGCNLKLECIPKDFTRQGDGKEVVSPSEVEPSPKGFPFEKRHKQIKERAVQDDCFRVVCYNILADMYADSDYSRDVLYPYCPAEALHIDYREQILLKEMAGYEGDIVCLQEVGKKFFQQCLQPILLDIGLNGLLQCKHKQVLEGEAIFYRTDKFRLIDEHNIVLCEALGEAPYSDLLEGVGRSPAMLKRFKDQATIAQVVVLEHISEPHRKLCIANTHLYFHPRAAHLRLVQTAIILRHLESLQALYKQQGRGDLSMMVCGDLNSNPSTGVYQYVTSGRLPHNIVDWYTSGKDEFCGGIPLHHHLDLTDACKDVDYTNFVAGFHGKLDHIFIQSDRLALDYLLPVSPHEEVTKYVALPNEVFPSDHMALVCNIRWL